MIIDDFILKNGLKWIPYNKFKNIKYLNEGGFGTIYRAIWLKNNGNEDDEEVILKCPKNLNENLNEFLKEWEYHTSVLSSYDIINIYGFTEDPNTSKYIIVMYYANKGNLRENLTRLVKSNWNQKLFMLYEIISGLSKIHKKKLIHCDFHDGNILNNIEKNKDKIYISDLGLCQPIKSFLKKYDIYAHDIQLSFSICKGERPEIIENTPKCYVNLMKKCWNEDPSKRPSTLEVYDVICNWIYRPHNNEVSEELKNNIMEFINAPIGHNNLITESHPKACYTSRLLDFTSKKLNEILESENLDDCIINDDMKSLDENTSKKLNEIHEKANEMLVNDEDLNDYIYN
ncbi:kinase-like protein [Rhizophagus irregularis]|uniref:Kinase-like protein n=1 Tax=Rhizophagus irregularis TaxID=588596 RepID=A0A2N0QXT3_9GLOM|nr:kinase-like protein [Rhizophagus irregularis]